MILDTSAVLAILRGEPEARACAEAIERAAMRRISAGSFLEAAIVIDASGDPIASRRLDELLHVAEVSIEPVTAEQVRIGREAYRDFGRGSGHRAQLNSGDCFAYALAKRTGEPRGTTSGTLTCSAPCSGATSAPCRDARRQAGALGMLRA